MTKPRLTAGGAADVLRSVLINARGITVGKHGNWAIAEKSFILTHGYFHETIVPGCLYRWVIVGDHYAQTDSSYAIDDTNR